MRFVDLLRTAVLLSAAAATLLAVVTVIGATRQGDDLIVVVGAAWWLLAALVGGLLGRRLEVSDAIRRMLTESRAATMLPEPRPVAVVANRLWPLLVATLLAGGVGFVFPQVPLVACGFTVIWALSWRRQDTAVTAIEERDGVTFFVERTSPVGRLKLVRTPGLRRETPTMSSVNRTG